ncbi:hypothetical protein FA15DRAFT_653180 [Coprinopsis marcescibilis]|uniref:Uncharacterized protein n=1 Tax=Coprinopsis marcescibilis TaxID=230819 RepID=A0A5C3L5Z2_COPMA|nr:hypothetical protein FA15DRAFT_653180 [Coprinopsis marcescibilis]
MSSQPRRGNNMKWWRDHYYSHPGKASKLPEALAGGQDKCYCKVCFDAHRISVINENQLSRESRMAPRYIFNGSVEDYLQALTYIGGFEEIVQQHITAVEDDDQDSRPISSEATRLPLIPICELFNFSNSYWIETFKNTIISSYDQELELFELLDFDADGVEEVVDVDEVTAQVLTS